MYCFNCGLEINENKAFTKKKLVDASASKKEEVDLAYVCPRCGHLTKRGASEEDVKALSRASHAQVQRGNNGFAKGMWLVSVGVILAAISFLFFLLARKTVNGKTVIKTDQSQFWVCVVLGAIAVVLLGFGIYFAVTGFKTRKKYLALLKDINNGTFNQQMFQKKYL